jgi:hypothetical protein
MSIEEAIKNLEQARDAGVKHIVLAYWEADSFDMQDDEEWAAATDFIDNKMDWSATHEDIQFHINNGAWN